MWTFSDFTNGFSKIINSIGGGLSSISTSIVDALSGLDFSDLTTSFSNTGKDILGAGADFLFGDDGMGSPIGSVGGIDDSSFDLGGSVSSAVTKSKSKGLIGGALDFIESNPKATELIAGTAAGAYGAYEKKKDREFLQQQIQQKNEQERNLLRERYDLNAKDRKEKSDAAFKMKA